MYKVDHVYTYICVFPLVYLLFLEIYIYVTHWGIKAKKRIILVIWNAVYDVWLYAAEFTFAC